MYTLSWCFSSTYLITLAIFNNTKNKFYEQDLPLLENVSSGDVLFLDTH